MATVPATELAIPRATLPEVTTLSEPAAPELVHKEVWTHVLAYNLIRTIMAQAAAKHEILPRSISFKGSMQTLEAFQPLIEFQAAHDTTHRFGLYQHMLDAIATHRVANRPDRYEPQVKKCRRNHYGWLTRPGDEMKRMMAKGLIKIYVPFVTSPDAEYRRFYARTSSLRLHSVSGNETPAVSYLT